MPATAQQTEWVHTVLGVDLRSEHGKDNFLRRSKAERIWQGSMDIIRLQMNVLLAVMRRSGNLEVIRFAETALQDVSSKIDAAFQTALGSDFDTQQDKGGSGGPTFSALTKFENTLLSDSLIVSLEDNAFGIDVGIRQMASQAISDIKAIHD